MRSGGLILAVALAMSGVLMLASNAYPLTVVPPKPVPKTLHRGSNGVRVKNLQWLLSGHVPSAYKGIKTYRGKIDGKYGKTTANAVWNMKYRLGYPLSYVNKLAGFALLQILLGKEKRPIQWIATAAKRQKHLPHPVQPGDVSSCQRQVVAVAYKQVGVSEYPWGSNRGPGISYATSRTSPSYQSITGAYGLAWCASFAQWVLYKSSVDPIADRSAGVFYIRDWAYRRGLLRAKPEPGTLVLYLWSLGHMGVVVKVTKLGFWTVEGNYSNQVAHVYHPFSRSAIAFVYLPRCS